MEKGRREGRRKGSTEGGRKCVCMERSDWGEGNEGEKRREGKI